MKLFLDTADVNEIKLAAASGLIDGVTTNPSLVAKAGRPFETVLKEICALVNGPISAEVISVETDQMITEGRKLAKIHPNITVKLPMIAVAMPAVKQLASEGIMTNVTLVFTVNQALLAAKAGATFVSPFVGRLDDIHEPGMDVVRDIVQVFKTYDFSTQVLAASMRHPEHIKQAALAGAQVATLPYTVFQELFNHPLTDAGLKKFLADWSTLK